MNTWHRVFSEFGTILLAFSMAVLVWVVALREANPIISNIYSQEIILRVIPPQGSLVLANNTALPDSVQVRLRGPQSSWQNLLPSKFIASVDLSNYPAGSYSAPISLDVFDPSISVLEVIPAQVSFQLDPLAQKSLPITVRINNAPPLGYFNRLPLTEPLSVTLTGPSQAINQVTQVVAEVSLENQRESLSLVRPLSARNSLNIPVREVSLQPKQVNISVPIEQRYGFKDVSVKAVVRGQPAQGYWISSIAVEPATLSIRGVPSVLDTITGVVETMPLDVSGASTSLVQRMSLNLPTGVTVVTEDDTLANNPSVSINVGIDALTGGKTIQQTVSAQGLGNQLTWSAAPSTVELILFGPLPILQNITNEDLIVTLNLSNLEPGVHRLQPNVIAPAGLEITSINPDTVEVNIQTAPAQLRPTPTSVNTATLTNTTSLTLSSGLTTSTVISPTESLSQTQEAD